MISHLEQFKNDDRAVKNYRKAMDLLRGAGVHLVLIELSTAEFVDASHPNGMQIAASKHYETLGYQKCLADLLSLDEIVVGSAKPVVADYGATQKMLAEGRITEQEANDFLKEK